MQTFDNNYFWATTGPLFSPNFSLANHRCSEIQAVRSMAPVPPQKKAALTCLRIVTTPRDYAGSPMGRYSRAAGPSPLIPHHYATPTPTTRSSICPIWPTKLLPATTSARLVVVASHTLARDDRTPLSTTKIDELFRNVTVQTVRFACLGT